MVESDEDAQRQSPATRLVRMGRDRSLTGPFVNPPVIHASTVLFDNVDAMNDLSQPYTYGRHGTPTLAALETAVSELEGAAGSVLCPSGLSAVSTALLACLQSGDRLLMVDCVYGPSRRFADTVLTRMGVDTVYFDPAVGGGIERLFGERTRAVYLEAPGSLTFEMQDLPAIAAVARARGALVIADNTWATPHFFKALALGADLSVIAGTKYLGGHADVMLGTVSANEAAWPRLKDVHRALGLCAGPDDVYLTLRGLRTLGIRLDRHMQSATRIASWLETRPEVARVLYPALSGDPGHALWKRDMKGASGLFSLVLGGWSEAKAKSFVDGLALFGIGASWGGYESLAILPRPQQRSTNGGSFAAEGPIVRLHIGLEDPGDLIADLEASFVRVAGAA
jgi:cystathionine beta-lyase